MSIKITRATSPEDIQQCMDIRITVFVEGQHVPIHLEVDGQDEDCQHYLLSIDENPAGTARVRFMDDYAKIERVAVLDTYKNKGFGKAIMQAILSDLKDNKVISMIKLSSQTYAIPFYEKLGFVICSEEYMDAGIPHKDMKLNAQSN